MTCELIVVSLSVLGMLGWLSTYHEYREKRRLMDDG